MKRRRCGLLLIFGLAMAGSAPAHEHHHEGMEGHWMAPEKAAHKRNPVKADEASISRGQTLFQTHCAVCHGPRGEGDGPSAAELNPKPANLKEMSRHHSDGDLAWKIATGRGAMPKWAGILKQKQIWDLVNYLRRLGDS